MAKKQTRRSISVSRTTYERLKAFCESNNISMSQFVETRVGDFLGGPEPTSAAVPVVMSAAPALAQPRPMLHVLPAKPALPPRLETLPPRPVVQPQPAPMTSAAARFAVEPPPPVIKRRPEAGEQPAPKPAEKRPDQIFTF